MRLGGLIAGRPVCQALRERVVSRRKDMERSSFTDCRMVSETSLEYLPFAGRPPTAVLIQKRQDVTEEADRVYRCEVWR